MYHDSDDDEDKVSRNDSTNTYEYLRNVRKRDMNEGFHEEYENEMSNAKRPKIDDEEEDLEAIVREAQESKAKSVAERMMERMGYKEGTGLGKNSQGIAEPVALSTQKGRTGFGSEMGKVVARDLNEDWDDSNEEKTIEEYVEWIPECSDQVREDVCNDLKSNIDRWIDVKPKKLIIDDETEFCDQEILTEMIKSKDVFDMMSDKDLREARTRANPYETIGSAFFQNRAAMKVANLDRVFDMMFSQENADEFLKKNPLENSKSAVNIDRNKELFYFADVCAGPGGFSEYMLWRKGYYNAKGFGFTLAGKDDFKLGKFSASSAYYFEPFYGVHKNGDVMDPENIDSLEEFVMKGTNNNGVHLMMADGGFSVDGQENIQEILSKRLYLCQLLVSLCIVKEGGNFFCKLFDIFTPFSVGLIYLMRICYDKVSLHKPHTSRPANSERYIICNGLRRQYSDVIKKYFKRINNTMDKLKNRNDSNDVQSIIPLEMLKEDTEFYEAIVAHNHKLARRQTLYLKKYLSFSKNQGQFDKDQGNLREECLKYWNVPNRTRKRGKEEIGKSLNALSIWGEWSPLFLKSDEFAQSPIEFRKNFLLSKADKTMTYEEYRYVRLATKSTPMILIAAQDGIFINRHGRFENMDKLLVRIPKDTIILVEELKEMTKEDNKIIESRSSTVLRIIDAAVLNGDDVSNLSLSQRLEAAKKFCKALKLGSKKVKVGWDRSEKYVIPFSLTAAEVYSVPELLTIKDDLDVVAQHGELFPTFTENGFMFKCFGIRFVRILKKKWRMGWSRSSQMPFAYADVEGKQQSIFADKWDTKVWSSFWDTAVMRTSDKNELENSIANNSGIGVSIPSTIWEWKNSLKTDYGIKKILDEDDDYKNNPTLGSIRNIITKTNASCSRNL